MVGGSAAGFMTAGMLAEAGKDVEVFERTNGRGSSARTLIVTGRAQELFGDEIAGATLNEINRFELFANGCVATVELDRPDLIVERAEVIRRYAQKAESAGARIHYGRRFKSLQRGDEIDVSFVDKEGEPGSINTQVLVGADGVNSRVARAAGWPVQPTVFLVQAIVQMPDDVAVDTSRVWFVPGDTPYFYWLVPESPHQAALGVIGEDGPEMRKRLDVFLKDKGFKVLGYQGAVIPAYQRWIPVHERVGNGDVYLVGDAAGQVKVSTVGGLVTGLRGAQGVAHAILEGRQNGHLSSLRRELDLHRVIRKAIHGFSQEDYTHILNLLNEPAKRSLAANDRDDASRILWSLLRSRPQLLLRGIRALLTRHSDH